MYEDIQCSDSRPQGPGRQPYIKLALTACLRHYPMWYLHFCRLKYLPGGDATSIHLGNAVCVLGALILGGFYGGLGGALGMTIGDLFDPIYVVYAPKTFLLKLCIGLITGLVAHKIGRINESSDKRHVFRFVVAASVCGLLFNVIFDPLVGYFYKLAILGKPAADLVLAWNIASTSINAVTSAAAAVVIYMPLRSTLIRSGLFDRFR